MKNFYHLKSNVLFTLLLILVMHHGVSQQQYLSKEEYRDKTLGMLLGTCGGVITGYEYLKVYNTPNGFYQPGATVSQPIRPLMGLPDDWFILLNGTLGGTTKDEYNYFSNFEEGIIYSDDDQHVDFFNQHILEKFGPSVTYEDIREEWIHHDLRDFGGTDDALKLIKNKDIIAPHCGKREHGNNGHWLPECYIEHESMGSAFPGMPNGAAIMTRRFSRMSGEGDNIIWGEYWAAAHAIAYFETDIRTVIQKALPIMPENCWPRKLYKIAHDLHAKYPNNWRAAVKELWEDYPRYPFAVGTDKIMLLAGVNNATCILAILYGENNYLETLKIISLAGGDGDCSAANICGILGIIHGMAGTPQEFKDRIYKNGQGVWINDTRHALHMANDYQEVWTFDQLTDLYQKNAENMIRDAGGVVTANGYTIPVETSYMPSAGTDNWDFEDGNLNGWQVWRNGGPSSIWAERQCNGANVRTCFAATGDYKGTVITESNAAEAKLYQTFTGLKPGATYLIEARLNAAAGREARLYAENYGGEYVYTSIYQGLTAFPFRYLRVKMGENNTSMQVGLHATATTNGSKWCSIDDLVITEIQDAPVGTRYEAEDAVINNATSTTATSASGGSYVGWINETNSYIEFREVEAAYDGEFLIRINYANANNTKALHKIEVNGRSLGNVEYPDTGPWSSFSQNFVEAPVKLNKGANTIRLTKVLDFAEIDYIEVLSPYSSGRKPADDAAMVDGGIYKIVARHSGKVLDLNGQAVNGSGIIQNTFTGAPTQYFKLVKKGTGYHIAPINNENKGVEVISSNMDNTAAVGLWDYWGGLTQKWAIIDADPGYYKIINHNSGKVLDVAGVSQVNGANVFQYYYLGGLNQQWRFDFVGMSKDNLPHVIPGRFEAEDYSAQTGIGTENTTDAGGGVNVMDLDIGEFLEYQIYVEHSGDYDLKFRVSSATSGGTMAVKIDGELLADYTIIGTGGWQTWTTVSKEVALEEGLHTLRLDIGGTEDYLFNINWIEATPVQDCHGTDFGTAYTDACGECVGGETGKTTVDTDEDGVPDCNDLCPNDAGKTAPGLCGCGNVDTDADNDGICDLQDDDMDNDGVSQEEDCDDNNPEITAATTWYLDADNDGVGVEAEQVTSCIQPEYHVATFGDECPQDAEKTISGECGCGETEESCLDCAGIPNGTAEYDDCGVCDGENACVDCAGTPNGDAFYDNCNECVSNEQEACTQDCAGEWGGEAFEDACEICAGGNTGIEPQEECIATGVESNLPKGILIYPNPFNKQLHVAVEDAYTIQIVTTDGKLLMEKAIENSTVFTLDYPAGVYVLKAFNQEHSFIQLITKY